MRQHHTQTPKQREKGSFDPTSLYDILPTLPELVGAFGSSRASLLLLILEAGATLGPRLSQEQISHMN